MDIRLTSFNFPRMRGGGPRTAEQAVVFPRGVDNAVAAITGYSAGYRGADHHLGRLEVRVETELTANVVTVRAVFGLRDWSGSWDDDYAGTIQVAVLAELVDPSLPPPRGDLQITGLEINQATQFFRSAAHLDTDNVMPDNAMTLVGGKSTGVRVYIDHSAAPGLPPISSLSGQLEVGTGFNMLTLSPFAGIAPRRDSEIDRGQVDHTLNFLIPGAWCRGTLELRCRVWDAAAPAQSSAPMRRSLRFVDVNPVRVYGVGVHYTGQGLDLAAPDVATVLANFEFTRRAFPVGDVLLSGYTTLDFDDDLFTNDTTGCGDGFEALQSDLKDLRGDSEDLFYGMLPTGIAFGTFIGCGGGGVGSGTVGDQVTAAHEAGHAFGRKHAPCDDVMRCQNPANQDGSFPAYGLYDSDSIGEFGYDAENDRVFDPAVSHDLMGYSGSQWISPYTYTALLSQADPVEGAAFAVLSDRALYLSARAFRPAGPQRGDRAEWSRAPAPMLFLSISVDADGKAGYRPAFTFPARPRLRHTRDSGYRIEVLDGQGGVRACTALEPGCFHCGPDCWPLHLDAEVPIDPARAVRLVLRHHGELVADWKIPPPPRLQLHAIEYTARDEAVLHWDGDEELVFLVQWQDEFGIWRGVAPRLTDRILAVPARLRHGRRALPVRVLASNGLATTIAAAKIEPPNRRPDPDKTPEVTIVTMSDGGPIVRAWAIDRLGRTLPNGELAWFDANGAELARGAALDTRALGGGRRIVRAVALNAGAGRAEREIEVDGRKPPPRLPRPARRGDARDACAE